MTRLNTWLASLQGQLLLQLLAALALIQLLLSALADWSILAPAAGPLEATARLLAVATPACAWLLRRALRQVSQLEAPLRRAIHEDQILPVEDHTPTELRGLVDAINELLERQRQSLAQQQRFLADASHQLRTPLAVLGTQLQGLVSGQLQAQDTLPRMLATVRRASHLSSQLLTLAKVDQLQQRGEWRAVDLAQVVREIAMEFAPLLARKSLDFHVQAVPLSLQTDAWMLGEMVRNLLSNAIHHSPHGASLGVVLRVLPEEAELIVWDNAGGVDEAVRDKLFKPFESAQGGTGIGLGLSICQRIAQSMDATVGLYNRLQDQQVVGVDAVVRWPLLAAGETPG
jgi:signal transduction histidine kinase